VNTVNSRLELRRTVNENHYPDSDIEIQLIHELNALQETKCIIEISHVKGHQDSTTRQHLTDKEKLNVEANNLTHIARKLPDVKSYNKFLTNKVNFQMNNKYISSHYPKMINVASHSMGLREHYARKHAWSSKTINSIWWATYYKSLSSLTNPEKLCIKKFVNNRWATESRSTINANLTRATSVNANYTWKVTKTHHKMSYSYKTISKR
jgi:hypothetical protein